MMNKLNALLIVILVVLITSCSTGKKAFTRGDYYAATLQAVSRLRSNPDSKKAIETLRQSYPYAVEYNKKQVNKVMGLNDAYKYSKVVGFYEQLNHLASEIERAPAARKVIPNPVVFTTELRQARELGAEERYSLGVLELKKDTRESAKRAYFHFIEADKMVKGYKDSHNLLVQSKYKATLKVLLQQIPVSGTANEISSIFFYNQIMEELNKSVTTEFVRFMTYEEANAEAVQVDQILEMNFQEFVVGQVFEKETIRQVSKDSVVVGQVTLDDGTTLNAYNTVKAKVKVFRRELISHGVLNVQSVDAYNGQVISQKKFPGQFVWASEGASFTGDERALSSKDQILVKHRLDLPPPPQTLFIEFTRPIYNQVVPYLKGYYNKYK